MGGPPSDKQPESQETCCLQSGHHLLLLGHCKEPRPGPGAAGRAGRQAGGWEVQRGKHLGQMGA